MSVYENERERERERASVVPLVSVQKNPTEGPECMERF